MAEYSEGSLAEGLFLLEKSEGKGGWTFLILGDIPPDQKRRFGQIRVKGSIDDYRFQKRSLMSLKGDQYFFPVNAEIRKKIKKEAGEYVRLTLFADETPLEISEELLLCLEDSPAASSTFKRFSEAQQQAFIDWIYSAKTEETKVKRIVATIERLEKGKRLYDP